MGNAVGCMDGVLFLYLDDLGGSEVLMSLTLVVWSWTGWVFCGGQGIEGTVQCSHGYKYYPANQLKTWYGAG